MFISNSSFRSWIQAKYHGWYLVGFNFNKLAGCSSSTLEKVCQLIFHVERDKDSDKSQVDEHLENDLGNPFLSYHHFSHKLILLFRLSELQSTTELLQTPK